MTACRLPSLTVLLIMLLMGCNAEPPAEAPIVVFVAASAAEVLRAVADDYQTKTGQRVLLNAAGSNVLAQQLMSGALGDLYVSANTAWMERLEEAGVIEGASRRQIARNQLVVVAHSSATWELEGIEQLAGLPFKFLAIGDPRAVPAGIYAQEFLGTRDAGETTLWDAVRSRVAPMPDVRRALTMVEVNRDAVGIVYATDAEASVSTRVIWEVPFDEAPVEYEAAVTASGRGAEFLSFLASDRAASHFERAGFQR